MAVGVISKDHSRLNDMLILPLREGWCQRCTWRVLHSVSGERTTNPYKYAVLAYQVLEFLQKNTG